MRKTILILAVAACLLNPRPARAAKIADITRMGGQRTNVLTGIGLVVGLKGTGDGGDFLPAMKPLAAMLTRFANPTNVIDLGKAQNVAIVSVTAIVPATGSRDGDHLDVHVMSVGGATSLAGGRLFICPMTGPLPRGDKQEPGIYALSEGPLVIEDPATPTVAIIKQGCVMEADLPARAVDNGRFTLIIEDPSASWTTAYAIAKTVNEAAGDDQELLAVAIDPKNVLVTIPAAERDRPDSFISRVQRLPVPLLPQEARVSINDKTGTLVITGDVEIGPIVISHRGLSISTTAPQPRPTPQRPVTTVKDFVAMDTTEQGGGKLQDLAAAFDQLKVPAPDRIAIVKEIHRSGKLYAKLILNGVEQ
jgi:flagellar P-ring protein precursor FlgI